MRTCMSEAGIKGWDKELHPQVSMGCNLLSIRLIATSGAQVPNIIYFNFVSHNPISSFLISSYFIILSQFSSIDAGTN